MKHNAIQDHKNCSLSSQDSGQTELKLSKFAMSQLSSHGSVRIPVVMEWMQFRAPRSGRYAGSGVATTTRWWSWWALMVVGLRALVSTRHPVSEADSYGGSELWKRASACFLAGGGVCGLSQHLAHRRLHLRHGGRWRRWRRRHPSVLGTVR